jgi:hypothetical protein
LDLSLILSFFLISDLGSEFEVGSWDLDLGPSGLEHRTSKSILLAGFEFGVKQMANWQLQLHLAHSQTQMAPVNCEVGVGVVKLGLGKKQEDQHILGGYF